MKAFVRPILLSVFVLSQLPLWGQVQINEFMAINRSYKLTSAEITVDWIELHNPDSQNAQLKDYYLTDDPQELKKYKLPELVVPANGYSLLTQGEVDRYYSRKFPFSLAGEGEFIALVAPDGITIVDSLTYGQQYPDQAFGRAENGTIWGILQQPTEGKANTKLKALLPEVVFSLPSAVYPDDSLYVEAWVAHPNAPIYYTFDGTEPDTNASLYDGPILLEQSRTIRAKAILDSANSPVSSFATYLLQDPKKHLILNLHGPDRWFNSPDSGILKISKYELGTWNSPVDPFNYLVDAELFTGDGVLRSRHQGRLKQHGAGSTYGILKSMRLHLSPSQAITGPLYRQKPEIENHRVIIIRQGGNSSDWVGLAVQDVLSSEYLSRKGWDLDYQAYQPVNVYINGQFHALMFFRERHDQHYYANNLQADPEEVSVVRKYGYGNEIDTGEGEDYFEVENFIATTGFRDTSKIKLLAERVDLDNYFKYLYFNDFIGNSDWPFNNFKLANPGGEGDRWRFCVYDTDFAYQYGANGIATLMNEGSEGFWLPKVLANDSLQEYFINYYLDLLNTEFEEEEFVQSLDYLKEYLAPDVWDHLEHWGPRLQGFGNNPNVWIEYLNQISNSLSQKKSLARTGLSSAFALGTPIQVELAVTPSSAGHIQLNTLDLQDLPWAGTYLRKNPVNIEAIARPGYRFVGWSDPLLPNTNKLRYKFDANCSLTAMFEIDSTYQPQLVINEIMYADDPIRGGEDWVELYNASESPIDLTDWVLGDETSDNRYVFPPGTLLPPDQYALVCRDPAAFLGAFPGTKIIPLALGFGLGKSDAVRIWNPAAELLDSVAYTNEDPWPQIANAGGASLALRDPQLKINYAQSWIRRQDYQPTPGERNELVTEEQFISRLSCVRFNAELFPNPMSNEFNLYFANSTFESIELHFLDLLGREIHSQTVPLRLGANYVQIPVDFLAQGHYILQLEQDGMIETVRIVKN